MLFVRETHHVIGERAREFESTYRDEWVPAVARDADARVLWYANHSHLTCFAYHALTITALRDGAAWTRMLERIHCGHVRRPGTAQLRWGAHRISPAGGSPPHGD